ncbi:hypothetical protein IG706_000048 [Listeria monocytogenes]|nr:hypothetical protein [Listeria monocytogenes]EGI8994138.1 hypothetical protein [Listeria monocytogenes]EHU3549111.1 hypothetical protein [Listeria monocytogenes]EHU3552230.1 hypothetical protein [Listeria monocytogenes]EHU3607691.1 hypothetical protein [Listeria monocytogenes]
MEINLVEEQFNSLDGATLRIMYDENQNLNLLELEPEKSGDPVSVWVDEELKNRMLEALTIIKLNDLDTKLYETLKGVLQKYDYNLIETLAAAKDNIDFMIIWMYSENKSLIVQKLVNWAVEQEGNNEI